MGDEGGYRGSRNRRRGEEDELETEKKDEDQEGQKINLC